MKKKKTFNVLLVAAMAATVIFTACGNSGSNVPAGTSASTKATTEAKTEAPTTVEETAKKIVVFQSKVEITDQLEALAKDYTNETGVEVEVWGTTGDDYFQQLKTRLGSNQGPTVFSLQPGAEVEQLKAYVTDLSDLSFAGDIAKGMATEVDGKVVGVPYTVEGFGLVYNKDLIDPAVVNNYDAFVKMLEEKKADGLNGFSLSGESYFLIGHILNTPFGLQADPFGYVEKLNAGQVKMADSPQFQEFGKFMEAIRANTNNPLEVNYDKETGDFATGKSASIHQGNWVYSMFTDYNVEFEMGMMSLPIMGNDKIAVSVPTAWFVNSQASEAEIKAGKEFLEWLYTSKTGVKYLMEEFGFIPVLTTMESPKLDPLSQEVARLTAEGKTISWPMTIWPAGIVDVHLVPIAEEFFTTDMTGEEFIAALDEAWIQANK